MRAQVRILLVSSFARGREEREGRLGGEKWKIRQEFEFLMTFATLLGSASRGRLTTLSLQFQGRRSLRVHNASYASVKSRVTVRIALVWVLDCARWTRVVSFQHGRHVNGLQARARAVDHVRKGYCLHFLGPHLAALREGPDDFRQQSRSRTSSDITEK